LRDSERRFEAEAVEEALILGEVGAVFGIKLFLDFGKPFSAYEFGQTSGVKVGSEEAESESFCRCVSEPGAYSHIPDNCLDVIGAQKWADALCHLRNEDGL